MQCSFCGYTFNKRNAKKGCRGCPLSKTCEKVKCPNCGFEMPPEIDLSESLKTWRDRLNVWFSKKKEKEK